jgi:protein TonB
MNRVSIVLALGVLAAARPDIARAQDAPTVSNAASDQAMFDFQVDQAVKIKFSRPPLYPERLRQAGTEGQVIVQFVVDESGSALMNTFKVLKTTDNELAESVRRAVSISSYYPAEFHGKKVKQLVQQPFKFSPRG